MNKSQEAFEAWWHEPHEFCRHPKIAYETGWQAALAHESLPSIVALENDVCRR